MERPTITIVLDIIRLVQEGKLSRDEAQKARGIPPGARPEHGRGGADHPGHQSSRRSLRSRRRHSGGLPGIRRRATRAALRHDVRSVHVCQRLCRTRFLAIARLAGLSRRIARTGSDRRRPLALLDHDFDLPCRMTKPNAPQRRATAKPRSTPGRAMATARLPALRREGAVAIGAIEGSLGACMHRKTGRKIGLR
jgi:hypothetical protein